MRIPQGYLLLIISIFLLSTYSHRLNGNPFKDDRQQAINLIVSGKILNDSSGQPVSNHSVMVKVPYIGYSSTVYTDTSGNYSDTIHELPGLGDTLWVSTFDCHNVIHIQAQPIASYSLVINFFICEKFSPSCIAEFITEIDSSSVIPNKYRFIDLSTGNPDRWIWNFGDGTSSAERNPSHIYNVSGHFQVCLTVSREQISSPCSDSSCTYISTPKYYSIGGHIFAGDKPINNPVSTSDTGIAYLYKLHNNHVIPFDTLTFTYLGYYSFPHLLSGDYLVKVLLTPNSANSRKYVPTYYIESLFWQQSRLLSVADSSIFNFDIPLNPGNDSLAGAGRISGKVERHTQTSGMFTIFRSEVLLFDSLKHMLTYTLSDASGNFSFQGLPYGEYQLFVESTGKFSKFTKVSLNAQSPVADTLVLDIYDHNITAVPEISNSGDVVAGLPFPNPSTGLINIPLRAPKPLIIKTSVYSMQSALLLETVLSAGPGLSMLNTDLSSLPDGIYIIIMRTAEGTVICRNKIIRSH
ncbi:MAG: PKD domain-containing protein [Bacteroidota bacterium]